MNQATLPTTQLLRLPRDVAQAIRRRAAAADVTLAEAARQLMQPREVRHHLGLIDHVSWLHGRLLRTKTELERVLRDEQRDSGAVTLAIDALGRLLDEWPDETDERYDFAAFGMGQPQ